MAPIVNLLSAQSPAQIISTPENMIDSAGTTPDILSLPPAAPKLQRKKHSMSPAQNFPNVQMKLFGGGNTQSPLTPRWVMI